MTVHTPIFVGATLLEQGKGGIAGVARMTIRALRDRGFQVDAASFLDSAPREVAGLTVRTAKGSRLAYLAMCHRAVWGTEVSVYDSVGMARAHPRFWLKRRPYAVWIHGVEVWWQLHADRKRALDNASLVLVNSQFTLDKYTSLHGPLPNARVCPLATEADEPPEGAQRTDGPPTVLFLGRLEPDRYKGQYQLVEAWPQVRAVVPDARLIIAGGGDDLERLRATVQASPAASSIEVLGFVPEDALAGVWARASVFAMPSRGEGFGLVYVEAMRHGLPVIAAVHDAGQEVNPHGVTGFNVDLDQPGDLANRLVALLRDPSLARRMGEAGFAHWQANYRYSAFRDRLLTSLQDVAGSPGKATLIGQP